MEIVDYLNLSNNQTKIHHDTCLTLEAYTLASGTLQAFSGRMYFKKVGARSRGQPAFF